MKQIDYIIQYFGLFLIILMAGPLAVFLWYRFNKVQESMPGYSMPMSYLVSSSVMAAVSFVIWIFLLYRLVHI